MRTNIELDEGLLAEAFRFSASRSKKALVHEALAAYVAAKKEERRRLSYKERLHKVRSETERLGVRPESHDIVRQDRDTR
jgi:Arc/MetJ family transcription regulator